MHLSNEVPEKVDGSCDRRFLAEVKAILVCVSPNICTIVRFEETGCRNPALKVICLIIKADED